jgi:hypothetical protein
LHSIALQGRSFAISINSPANFGRIHLKPFANLLFAAIALSLSACGGGGDDTPAPPSIPNLPAPSLAEFEGLWKRDAASDVCLSAFPYNTAYHYRVRDLSVAIRNNNLEATLAYIAYGDAGCTIKQGLVTETFVLNPQLAVFAGRSNVIKGTPAMIASTIGADGGLGLSLTKMPDGTVSQLKNGKFTADLETNKLYVTTSTNAAALDGGGFPSAFLLSEYFVR